MYAVHMAGIAEMAAVASHVSRHQHQNGVWSCRALERVVSAMCIAIAHQYRRRRIGASRSCVTSEAFGARATPDLGMA